MKRIVVIVVVDVVVMHATIVLGTFLLSLKHRLVQLLSRSRKFKPNSTKRKIYHIFRSNFYLLYYNYFILTFKREFNTRKRRNYGLATAKRKIAKQKMKTNI